MSTVQDVANELKDYIETAIANFPVIPHWPLYNQKLPMPCASISIAYSSFVPCFPDFPQEKSVSNEGNVTYEYKTGEHNFTLNLDIWAKTYKQMDEYLEILMGLLNRGGAQPNIYLSNNTLRNNNAVLVTVDNRIVENQSDQRFFRGQIVLQGNVDHLVHASEPVVRDIELDFILNEGEVKQ